MTPQPPPGGDEQRGARLQRPHRKQSKRDLVAGALDAGSEHLQIGARDSNLGLARLRRTQQAPQRRRQLRPQLRRVGPRCRQPAKKDVRSALPRDQLLRERRDVLGETVVGVELLGEALVDDQETRWPQ